MAYLDGVYRNYRRKADQIEWQKMDVNDLFRDTIIHENDSEYETYFAALVCRFWGYSGRIYTQCNRHITFEECLDCIIDALRYVLEKRVWENPSSSLFNDPKAPDKAMHIAMKRQKGIMLSKFNAQRRMTNFNTLSIDEAHENFNDSAEGILFEQTNDNSASAIVSSYFNKGDDYLSGMILDCICFGNSKPDPVYIARDLRKTCDISRDHYSELYNADAEEINKTIKTIKKMSNQMLEMKIKALLYTLKKELSND